MLCNGLQGNACNVALDCGISCLELAKDEPEEVQVALHKMYNVIYTYEIKEVSQYFCDTLCLVFMGST